MTNYETEVSNRLGKISNNKEIKKSAEEFLKCSIQAEYSYNYYWLGRPIIQYPQDILAVQEIIWKTRPNIIIETGIAHGGSLILSASLLALLDLCEAQEDDTLLDPKQPKRRVIGVDIDIRDHNRLAIENHPLSDRISMIEGSSIDADVFQKAKSFISKGDRVLVFLDSNHTYKHVLNELYLYAPLVNKGGYIVVFDTIVDDLSEDLIRDRPWGPGNSPKTAVLEYLEAINKNDVLAADGSSLKLEIDVDLENKLLISASPKGYLKRV